MRESRRTSTTAFTLALEDYLLLGAIVLLPWAFGGVEIWAYRSAALLLVGAACVALWRRGWPGVSLGAGAAWLLPAFLLAAWGALQLVPLPPALVRVLSPAAHRAYSAAFPGYGGGGVAQPLAAIEEQALARVPEAAAWPPPEGGGMDVALAAPPCLGDRMRPLSLEPTSTAERLLWYVALLLGFLVLCERLSERRRQRVYQWAFFGLCAALALFALVQLALWNGKIYWVRRLVIVANPFGPYYNPTNLAGVMELAVPALVGFAWSRVRRRGRLASYEAGFGLSVAMAGLCLVAGFVAASKLAALLLASGLVVLGLAAARTHRGRLGVIALAVAAAGVASVALMESRLGERLEMFLGRAQSAHMLEGRVVVWRAGLSMLRDYALTGSGFGTFREVIPGYLPAGASSPWGQAHNDYLELLLDGGLVAGVLMLWLAWGYVRRARRALGGRRERSPRQLGLAVGVASLAVHAFFDFNHQIPADALLWLTCCALLLSGGSAAKEREA